MSRLAGAKVMLTRATGFLGKYIDQAVQSEGGLVFHVSRQLGSDLLDPLKAVEAAIVSTPDIIIHLCSGRSYGELGALSMREELLMAMNVIHAAQLTNAKLVMVSRVWPVLARENQAPFALASLLRAYGAQYNLPWVWVLVPTLYGPGAVEGAVPAILSAFGESAKESTGKCALPGTGKEPIGLLFAADAAKAVVLAAASRLKSDIIQLPESQHLEAQALSAQLVSVCGYAGNISWNPELPAFPEPDGAEQGEVKSLGWKPEKPLKDGLLATATWYVQIQEALKPPAATEALIPA
jgi:nucleoside-diphosphate-sugar epimerase